MNWLMHGNASPPIAFMHIGDELYVYRCALAYTSIDWRDWSILGDTRALLTAFKEVA